MKKHANKLQGINEFHQFSEVLFNQIKQFIIILDANNHIVTINDRAKEEIGSVVKLEKLIANKKIPLRAEKETSFLSKNKKQILVRWRTISFKQYRQTLYMVIGEDVTELELLKTHVYTLDYVVKKVPGYVFWKDKKLKLMGCNENFAKQVGLKKTEDIVGKTDYYLPWDTQQTKAFLRDDREVIKTGISKVNIEESQRQKEGTQAVLLTNKVPIYNEKGEISGVLGMYVDITQLKNTELALKEEKKKAEMASVAKSEFIANMSHDIRTPLTGILGMAQILQARAEGENREDAGLLISASEELLNLLNEILELVQIETGQMQNGFANFNLTDLITHNIHLHIPAAKHKQLQLKVRIDPQLPKIVYGQKILLDRVLLNLLSNAIKFTKKGRVFVSVQLLENQEDKIIVQLVVEDTGIGIPKDKIPAIFEHFSRLTPSYQGIYKGSGLGLYTVKQYLENMQGEIQVESEVDKGSRFIATIPLQKAKQGAVCVEEQTQGMPNYLHSPVDAYASLKTELPVPAGDTVSVLLVEDHPLAAKTAQTILQSLNCHVHHAVTGKEAIQKIQSHDYELIFMDIGLPDQDGLSVAKKIRQLTDVKKSQTPIVALTAHLKNDKQQSCVNAGIQEIITKPLTVLKAEVIIEKFVYAAEKEISADAEGQEEALKDIDLTMGANIMNANMEAARDLLKMLVGTLKEDNQAITAAYEQKKYSLLSKALHRLYGSLCYCGVPKLQKVAKELKLAADEKNDGKIKEGYQSFQLAIEQFLIAYKKLS